MALARHGSGTVKIEIYDQTYRFGDDQDEEYLKKLAAYVDEKMRAVGESTRTVDSLKVAVLAPMANERMSRESNVKPGALFN